MSHHPPEPGLPPEALPGRIDVRLDAAPLEPVWERVDSQAHEISPAGMPREAPAEPRAHDPMDWDLIHDLLSGFLGDVIHRYFRAEIIGAEKIPLGGPLIIAPNHSGNAFPHDAVVLDGLLWEHFGRSREGKFRSVYTPQLAAVWWMRPYGIDNWWRRGGGVDMTFGNYDALLGRGDKVIYYPEGVPGIGKGFLKRYQLQHFHSSFVVLADKHQAPVYPVAVVNAEWVNPTAITFGWLNRLAQKVFKIPFFPIPIVLLVLVFPFIFYLAFPCRMVFVVGDPLDVRRMLREEGSDDPEQPDREAVLRVAERIRRTAQEGLDAAVARHGEKPYDLKGLWASLKKVRGRIWRTTPFGWPYTYLQFVRDRERPPARNRLHRWVRDLDILFFYVPFGWLGIALTRALRRPPYGYRGLTREQRMEREGSFRWSLETRPLPPCPRPSADASGATSQGAGSAPAR